jgi:hypothetical protein
MKSTSSSRAPDRDASYARELIEKEIAHLKKGRSSRQAQEARRGRAGGIIFTVVVVLFALYALDPFLFSYHRGQAIRAYLYLHNYGDDRQAAAVAACGLLRPGEVLDLNRRQGAFQDYFAGTGPAEQEAAGFIHYMDGVRALHKGDYNALSPLNKLRYVLFVKTGLMPPIRWDFLNSSVDK